MNIPDGQYEFTKYENEIKEFWLSKNFYKPEYNPKTQSIETTDEMKKNDREAFSIICPPPNAYGRPHMGNLSGYAYQDAMGRYQRMQGKKVLLLPGKDHAGLEGEGVFVREVLEKQGINKFDLSRDEFYKMIWDYNMENKAQALKDEQTIGLSADFDRDIFTLDEKVVNTVLSTFVKLYQENMVYKGVRIVNWDPKARSVIADNQCVRKEKEGFLYYVKYPLALQKSWTLNFYTNDTLENINTGKKSIETRALNPEEPERFFGNISEGDLIICKNKSDHNSQSVYKKVKKIEIFKTLEDAFHNINWQEVFGIEVKDIIDLEQYYAGLALGYADKIRINGLVALHLEELADSDYLTVATTRPETMLGDTALVVNPEDDRYKNLTSAKAIVPLVDREIPIITDYKIEKDFGTGVLKLTPSHAQDDYEIMMRWNASIDKESHDNSEIIENSSYKQKVNYINVINKDLKICGPENKYSGMKINAVKIQIIEDLKTSGLLTKEEGITQNILISDRTGATIEPIMSSQWFMDIDKIRQPVIDMVQNGDVKIHPKSMEKKFFFWMENLRDWAISRSLWWGYRIPVWYHGEISEEVDSNGKVVLWININGQNQELDPSNPEHMKVQIENPEIKNDWHQDPDVFDTWFSSGQWPYATLQAFDLMDTFYPTNVMETGYDILENWVSRMMMFSYFNYKTIPFKDVYLHGLVKGTDGQKMSKSKKNIIPMDDVEKNYGIDTLRMCYFFQNKAGKSYAITFDKLKNFRNFNNKIWNASKFVLMGINNSEAALENTDLMLADRSILNSLNFKSEKNEVMCKTFIQLHEEITNNMNKFKFGAATETLYASFWHEYCDKYIEEAKELLKSENLDVVQETLNTLVVVLTGYLKLLHPFIPHVTEKVYQVLKNNDLVEEKVESLMYTNW